MDLGLKGKVAAVAASSSGLGKAVALGLAREGASVALCSRGERLMVVKPLRIMLRVRLNITSMRTSCTPCASTWM